MLGVSRSRRSTILVVRSEVSFAPGQRQISPIIGGLLALTYPLVLVTVSLSVGFRRGGDMGEFAATVLATILFLIAAPTSWIFAFPFIDVTRFTVLVFGVLTSIPVWYLMGVALARRAEDWPRWLRSYAVVCVTWTAMNLVVVGVVAAASS